MLLLWTFKYVINICDYSLVGLVWPNTEELILPIGFNPNRSLTLDWLNCKFQSVTHSVLWPQSVDPWSWQNWVLLLRTKLTFLSARIVNCQLSIYNWSLFLAKLAAAAPAYQADQPLFSLCGSSIYIWQSKQTVQDGIINSVQLFILIIENLWKLSE